MPRLCARQQRCVRDSSRGSNRRDKTSGYGLAAAAAEPGIGGEGVSAMWTPDSRSRSRRAHAGCRGLHQGRRGRHAGFSAEKEQPSVPAGGGDEQEQRQNKSCLVIELKDALGLLAKIAAEL